MTPEERKMMLTLGNVAHIAVLTLSKTMKYVTDEDSDELEYERHQLHDLAEQVREIRDKIYSDGEVRENIEPMNNGRFTKLIRDKEKEKK